MFRVNFQTDQPDCDLGVYVDNSGRQWEFDLEYGEEFIEDDEGKVYRIINKRQHDVTEQVLWIDVEELDVYKVPEESMKSRLDILDIMEMINNRKIYINHLHNEMFDCERDYEKVIKDMMLKNQLILDPVSEVIEEWKEKNEYYRKKIDTNVIELNILEWLIR